VWDKVGHNHGHYNSVRHELLLVGGIGSATPETSKLYDSVQSVPKSDVHSEKPDHFRTMIDTLYPSAKKIELFARDEIATDLWSVWGDEV
jgi:N6-adenosine-specific RNA methylase IME4